MKRLLILAVLGYSLAIAPTSTQALPSTMPTADSVNPYHAYIYPAQGTVTSGFGWRWGKIHKGIDLAAPVGTPIFASAKGVVSFAGWDDSGYGSVIKIQHTDGSETLYAHNSKLLVHKSDYVEQGQVIAAMGSTGRSTGSHCHFEIHLQGHGAVNPLALLSRQSNVVSRATP